MSKLRILNIAVLAAGVAAAFYYAASDNEAQGTVIVLLAVLYFVAIPHITRS